ncbi:hypothetical protein N800_04005 [Lysobacter daejeonensis GH1-9]|uniref:Transmembrane protein n=1 Tax=Lysobacter daejeonensis GH1-9 TaxID=1385517 RepID=A0A0A0ESK1_9GAMM|nr:DUF2069 domain-containing protein [Lysobacter daejeonensis]KGM53896.1 hypothetical protein N800_04005 [Lysobacter daejeonensis GH1-9]
MNELTPLRARARVVLLMSLVALAALYVAWFSHDANPWAEWLVFALPPALLALGVWRRRRTAGFWAAVLALFWFSHGVMVAWSRPPERGFALAVLALAVVVVFAASLPGLQSRFAGKRKG